MQYLNVLLIFTFRHKLAKAAVNSVCIKKFLHVDCLQCHWGSISDAAACFLLVYFFFLCVCVLMITEVISTSGVLVCILAGYHRPSISLRQKYRLEIVQPLASSDLYAVLVGLLEGAKRWRAGARQMKSVLSSLRNS